MFRLLFGGTQLLSGRVKPALIIARASLWLLAFWRWSGAVWPSPVATIDGHENAARRHDERKHLGALITAKDGTPVFHRLFLMTGDAGVLLKLLK